MQSAVTDALTRAFFKEWANSGYAALSLERVAKSAGVGKAALYRRWPSKIAMAVDLLEVVGIPVTDIADTGTLEGDVRSLLLSLRRLLRHPIVRRILPDLHAETARSTELSVAIRPLQIARRKYVGQVVARAISRGELAETIDHELAADLIGAPMYWRIVVIGGRADLGYVDRLSEAICAAMKK